MIINDSVSGEIWRVIQSRPNYQVSNLGRIRKIKTKVGLPCCKYLTVQMPSKYQSYCSIILQKKRFYIHRLVATAFIPNPKRLPQVNHKDGNKANNNVDNLEWVTRSENGLHAYNVLHIKPSAKGRFGKDANRHKAVNVYSLSGEYIKRFETITEASQELNIETGSICHCAKGEYKSTHGYIFKYSD